MKKLIATVLVAMIAFVVFAGVSVTLDAIAQYSSKKVADPTGEIDPGFTINGAEYDESSHGGNVLGELTASLTKSNAGTAMISIRFRNPMSKYAGATVGYDSVLKKYFPPVNIHAWDITARLTSGLKVSLGNTAYEVFAESVNWEPISGAGLFEQGTNRIYIDYIPSFLSDMEIIAGVSMGQDDNKPWKTLQAAVTYDFDAPLRVAFEFHNVHNELGNGTDGEVKALSFQAYYFGVENMEVLAGYSLVLENGSVVQHRGDFFFTYFTEKLGIELYDALLLRLNDQGKGNRLALKLSYYATEKLTPFVRMNWFRNYGYANAIGGLAWGDWQLTRDTFYGGNPGNLLVLDAGFGITLSESFLVNMGATIKVNLTKGVAKEDKVFWTIPLAMTVSF